MRHRGLILGLGAAAVAALLGAWASGWRLPFGAPRVPRNVLLVTIDTLRADRVGCYGSTRGLTPALDALAAEGARFSNAYTPVPMTAPSHSTILTGRYPLTHGLRNNGGETLSAKETLVSEILKERGFRTAAIVSSLVLTSEYGLNQGFDLYYQDGIKGSAAGQGLWYDQRPADQSVDRALTWLKAESDHPFFLWLHLFDPHDPYDPPSPFKEKYAGKAYDGEIAFTDSQVARLLQALKEMGLYDDTLIIVTADHGEGLGEHVEQYHAIFLYNTTTHVPLIVKTPGGPRGVVVDDLASTLDIASTILEALRLPIPGTMQGVSLFPAAAQGGRVPARTLFLETIYPTTSYGWATTRAHVTSSWKLVDLPKPELYDLAVDPSEKGNLHASQKATVDELRAEYDKELAALESSARKTEAASIDDETRDKLLSLGYIGGQQSSRPAARGPDPKDVAFMTVPLRIASTLTRTGKPADAVEVLHKALEVDPANRFALIEIGQALERLGKVDEAIPFFERAVTTYPDVEEFYRAYGWMMLRSRRFPEAEKVFERAATEMPESAHSHFMLGYTRFFMKRWDGARQELELAVGLDPKMGKPHYLLAICLIQGGDEKGALAAIEEYLKRDRDIESLFADPYFVELRKQPAFQEMVKKYL